MQQTDSTPAVDSRVASLKAIFPDFDDAVILSVLESTNNDHDRALDVLLGMNDPSFVAPNPPPPAQSPNPFPSAPSTDAQRLSQEALDEQLARRLALEEQQAATTPAWQQPQGTQLEGQTMYQPYQPRRGGRNDQPQNQGQGRDTMTELQEGFSRIAESGKKTFSSIVSKVKAKMQEFDQGQGWSGGWSQYPAPNQPPPPGTSAPYTASYTQGQPQGYGQSAYTQSYQYAPPQDPPPRTSTSSPPRSGVSRPEPLALSASAQKPSYYDPNARGYDLYDNDHHEIELHDITTPAALAPAPVPAPPSTASASAPAAAVGTTSGPTTTHPDNVTSPPPPSESISSPSYASPVSPPPSNAGFSSLPPAGTNTARHLSPGARGTAGGSVDFSKLGLLPKRPISLVRAQSPPQTPGNAGGNAPRTTTTVANTKGGNATDREEPEFVENPFEDHK